MPLNGLLLLLKQPHESFLDNIAGAARVRPLVIQALFMRVQSLHSLRRRLLLVVGVPSPTNTTNPSPLSHTQHIT
mgnify:CR=1 FL=1